MAIANAANAHQISAPGETATATATETTSVPLKESTPVTKTKAESILKKIWLAGEMISWWKMILKMH